MSIVFSDLEFLLAYYLESKNIQYSETALILPNIKEILNDLAELKIHADEKKFITNALKYVHKGYCPCEPIPRILNLFTFPINDLTKLLKTDNPAFMIGIDMEEMHDKIYKLALEIKNDSNYRARAYAFDTYSSKRYKENIKLLNSIDIVNKFDQFNAVTFNWKKEFGDHGKDTQIGFIAEEINKVFPEIVTKDKDNIPTGVDYAKLVPGLFQYVKYLKHEIDELKQFINNIYK
jgi:hypothetical protein